jgi:hypothetical protein
MSRVMRIVVGMSVAVALAACGGSDDSDEATGTTAPATTTTLDGSGSSTTAAPDESDVWRQSATQYRGENGERYTLECTPNGTEGRIWGVETYTDDSSICTAAVHVGLITFEEGGEVEYEIAPGLDEYEGAIGNDVLSLRFAEYPGSFIFPAAPPGSGEFTLGAETWQRTAVEYADQNGEEFTIVCAPGGPIDSIWGTGTYTNDSSICTAAVHAGLITVEDGGSVTIEIAPGEDSYEGSTANGVTSTEYGSYGGSFTFPDDQPTD